ncbi:hypothetical protein AC482_01635 [miscellaneous Crenarchaeota group-15 archaeon DG-45]|uniref:5-oxoprolinase n=1 Tax=miscellaneous Crenarchaeota group-15 archaeon DG-45 TaxID=1685127 RepID=A0A0M0BRX0_9ARCH|nr:MAG: hypothetical protein AC482_01635 [miscellaneous Crenarchaeota group-15 archaeon DG-45]
MLRVSVDVGGTFTDLVALDEGTGELLNIKVPSVPRNPEKGVVDAFGQLLRREAAEAVRMVGHATTIATNALFGQVDLELPRTALITTRGFRDVIEIGRQRRAEVYNLFFRRPPTLVERRLRYEVEERIDAEGKVLVPLDAEEVEGVLGEIEGEGVESLAIGFLNSYANPRHEEEVLERARRLPGLHLTASSRVSNEYREYERLSTAVVNAALKPIIHAYISQFAVDLGNLGVGAPLYVMQSNGGMAAADVVAEKPATIVESGPASGVIAAAWLGGLLGEGDIISFDMGGTTAKAGAIRGRVPEVVSEYEVAGRVHMGRLVKGSGYPVRFPVIDLAECSAGGGTIARVDEGGALRVGPTSAGASPGPACYGLGGEEATITDANLILGRLNPHELLGGEMPIHPRLARRAIEGLGRRLGMGPEEAAVSVVRIANAMMSRILRIVSVERGFDPRRFTLVAFGGAGPMHACALAEELGIGRIVVPPNPGMFSAVGLLSADLFHDHVRALVRRADEVDPAEVEVCFREMEGEGRGTLAGEGVGPGERRFLRRLDLRYLGQAYELTVGAPDPLDAEGMRTVVEAFHLRHREVYGYAAEGEPVELVNVRLRAVGIIPKPHLRELPSSQEEAPPRDNRPAYFEGPGCWIETPVYDREALGEGWRLEGPAVVEQYDATTVVYPGWDAAVDRFGNLVLGRGEP